MLGWWGCVGADQGMGGAKGTDRCTLRAGTIGMAYFDASHDLSPQEVPMALYRLFFWGGFSVAAGVSRVSGGLQFQVHSPAVRGVPPWVSARALHAPCALLFGKHRSRPPRPYN